MFCLRSLLLTLLFFAATAQDIQLPVSPCPHIFKYTYKRPVIAEFTLENDFSGLYELAVNMISDTDTDILLWLATPRLNISQGANLTYYAISKDLGPFVLASVVFQRELICHNSAATGGYRLSKTEVTSTMIDEVPMRPSLDGSNSIQTHMQQPVSEICGRRQHPRTNICGGYPLKDAAYEGDFPWLVAMFIYKNGTYEFGCGGTLVSRTHVITAGHCLKDYRNMDIADWKRSIIALGRHDLGKWQAEAVLRGIERYAVHPDYKKPSDADLAVVKLDKPVEFGDNIMPICLWDDSQDIRLIEGKLGDVGGWERNQTWKRMKASFPVIAQYACLKSDPAYFNLLSDRTFCAGIAKDGWAPCSGSSGIPFMMESKGRWRLRGIASSGLVIPGTGKCNPAKYVVYSDLAQFKPWIIAQLDGYM